MSHTDLSVYLHLVGAFGAAFMAGAINSVAGGGTMVSFPLLMFLGLPPVIANATNTCGIWPGAIGSIWGFRRELKNVPKALRWFIVPALLGGAGGAFILKFTSENIFTHLVPWLLLFATVLFAIQTPVQKWLKSLQGVREVRSNRIALATILQMLVGLYGGYFGAGMSIMMLSILAVIGMADILEMSAMTSFLSLGINGIAGLIFALSGMVEWSYVGAMAVGAIAGGYGAAGMARKIGKTAVRKFVIFVGFSIAVLMFIRISRG